MILMKLKFKPSLKSDKEGFLYFHVIHGMEVRKVRSKYKILNEEWDERTGRVLLPPCSSSRFSYLFHVCCSVEWELQRLSKVMYEWESSGCQHSLDEVIDHMLSELSVSDSVFNFMHAQVVHKKRLGKMRTSETYQSTLNSFMRFRRGHDLTFDMMNAELLELYEADLRRRGLSRNTTSFYMRILRTNYKLAIEKGLTTDNRPFRHVYCGMDKTVKRSISFAEIKKIGSLDLSGRPALDFARDMFMFSFCMRGMSFVDMAYLKKKDLKNGHITYRRKKTGQLLNVEWTRQMQNIVDKYKFNATGYLLPIILREDGTERRQYQNQMMKVNRHLKEVANLINLAMPLSLYCSRHSWATIAREKDIPLSVISEGLGHDSEATTQIYLDSIKSSEVDKANRKILKDL